MRTIQIQVTEKQYKQLQTRVKRNCEESGFFTLNDDWKDNLDVCISSHLINELVGDGELVTDIWDKDGFTTIVTGND